MSDLVETEVLDAVPATASAVAPMIAPEAANDTLNDCSPARQAEQRYLSAVGALVDDAQERNAVETLVEVLTWTLARIAYAYGPGATGDTLRRLGAHLCEINAREQAEREAAEAKKKGVATH